MTFSTHSVPANESSLRLQLATLQSFLANLSD